MNRKKKAEARSVTTRSESTQNKENHSIHFKTNIKLRFFRKIFQGIEFQRPTTQGRNELSQDDVGGKGLGLIQSK